MTDGVKITRAGDVRAEDCGAHVDILPCPGGPVLVRGAQEIVDAHGTAHAVSRPVVAVCRCGNSGRLPWCDGTHKV